MIPLDQQILVDINSKNFIYTLLSYHRDFHSKKSQWTITRPEEVECFKRLIQGIWFDKKNKFNIGWSLHLSGVNALLNLGKVSGGREVKIAKIIENSNGWHGYPADYIKNIHDRPAKTVLSKWYSGGLIKKHQLSKISSGKVCSL